MKNLIEISKIVTKKKVKKIEIFDEHSLKNKNSKFNEFYEALMANKFKNDRDAATFLYDCRPTDDKYRQLKSRFRKRLLNTLFFLDVNLPSTSSYDRAYFSCNKDWTLVKILLSNNADNTAASLAKQILTTALKFKFADVIVNCSRILRRYYAYNGLENDFEIYDAHIKQYSNILEAEIRSEELYQRVLMNYLKPKGKSADIKEKIDTFCDALVGLSESFESPVITYHMFLVWAYRYEMLFDFELMLEVCSQAEQYIEAHPHYYQDEKLASFLLMKMSAYLHLRDWRNGKNNAEKSLSSFPTGSLPWYNFMEYYIMLAIHTENYLNAVAIYEKATTHRNFKKLPVEKRELWNIFNIYINYIIETEVENIPILASTKRKSFIVNKFLDNPLLYNKNLRIFTVQLVIAQILFLLEKRNYSAINERVDRLKGYANRQLKKEEFVRVVQMIRLIQQAAKANFEQDRLSNTEKYLTILKQNPFYYRGQINEIEIIPFEKIWDKICSKLER